MPRVPVLLVLLLTTAPLTGCLDLGQGPSQQDGVVVTGQPILDAFQRMNETDELVGIPDWAATAQPIEAERIGRPFAIPPEAVLELSPEIVFDQPHPLVAGPSRSALEQGLKGTNITYQRLPTDPTFSTIRATLQAVENTTGTPAEPTWTQIQTNLDALNDSLQGSDQPNVLVLFPAGLTAGQGTDIDHLLTLVHANNIARDAGLTGYAPITNEAIQRANLSYVLATSTMKDTPQEIANKPMFDETPIADNASRILVVDPSWTMRYGPYLDHGAHMLATWLHEDLPGPRIHATIDRYEPSTCTTFNATTTAPNATITFLNQTHEPGPIPVPHVEPGHYRLRIQATDPTGTAFLDQLITIERFQCNDT